MPVVVWMALVFHLVGSSLALGAARGGVVEPAGPVTIRVATFNLGDVRTAELKDPTNARVRALAEVIQRVRPNVILLNEIAYDQPGAPGVAEGEKPGQNARRFVESFLAKPQAPGLTPLRYRAFMAPVNTGMPSGFDLNNDGRIVNEYPPALPGVETVGEEARAYGEDCWGFGTFPGQYGMALLVDERLTIVEEEVRTFRLLPWDYVDGAFLPTVPGTGEPWFDAEELKYVRLSSKSHWDVPVRLPNGATVHLLCSHPTPPVFDGAEDRNGRRNHDEIRFWADYIDDAFYIVDDANRPGGLREGASFVVLGDLNADPEKGDTFKEPMQRTLLANPRVNASVVPRADLAIEGLEDDDTAAFKLRVDYVLPSTDLRVLSSGVWRHPPTTAFGPAGRFPSDHFPVWVELSAPPPAE